MRIGIDIDDTLTDTASEIEKLALKYNSEYDNKLIDNMYAMLRGNIENEYIEDFYKKHATEISLRVNIREKAKETIDKLIKDGHTIYFITARSSNYYKDPYELTKYYLKEHDINYNELIIGHNHKVDICKEKKIDLFIDDAIDTIQNISKEGIDALLFSTKYNGHAENMKRVYNWNEIYEYISNK